MAALYEDMGGILNRYFDIKELNEENIKLKEKFNMIKLEECKNIFIDFDGVIVNSNKFKELAIEESIFQLFGENKNNVNAINYFNKNAGISRKIKLSLFFEEKKNSKRRSGRNFDVKLWFRKFFLQ